MKKTNNFRVAAASALSGLVGFLPNIGNADTNTAAKAQSPAPSISGDIEYNHSEHSENDLVELNAFYKLPGKVKGFTWMDFKKKSGFFGKSTLTRDFGEYLQGATELVHGNKPLTETRVGAYVNVPMPKGIPGKPRLNLRYMPLCIDSSGDRVHDKQMVGYCATAKLPMGMNALAFGWLNAADDKGISWNYGELDVSKAFGKDKRWVIAYNPALTGKGAGKATPHIENRVAIRRKF
jgi:hypothetical protein